MERDRPLCVAHKVGEGSVYRSDKYRLFAEQCMEMASSATDEQIRAALVQMAQVWFRLAEEHEERTARSDVS